MQKPLINNRRLNEKWSAQTNELMIKKLQGVKPQINSRCPESFFFFKTQFKKPNLNTNKLAKLEIAKNNETLLRKLLDVNIERNSKSNQSRRPVFTFKKNFLTGNKKYDIIKIAQENQSMLKRLNERSSFYDVNKWEKDYQMNQYYKRNHCLFPSIDFKKSPSSGLFNSTVKSSPGRSNSVGGGMTLEKRKYNNSCSDFNQIDNYPPNVNEVNCDKGNYIQLNEEDAKEKDYPKVLFKTQVYLGSLGSCTVEFIVQTQNFTIKIESVYEKDKVYGIIFDSRQSVENIQKYYKKYEEMIKELEYDEKNDVVKFNNIIKKDLICRCIKMPPKNSSQSSPKANENKSEANMKETEKANDNNNNKNNENKSPNEVNDSPDKQKEEITLKYNDKEEVDNDKDKEKRINDDDDNNKNEDKDKDKHQQQPNNVEKHDKENEIPEDDNAKIIPQGQGEANSNLNPIGEEKKEEVTPMPVSDEKKEEEQVEDNGIEESIHENK